MGTNFSEIRIGILSFSFTKMHLKLLSAKSGGPFVQGEMSYSLHDDVIKWNHFRVTGHLCGEFLGHWWIPHTQRPVTRSFDVLFDLRLNERLINQCWGWRFETPSRPLWLYCNGHTGLDWLHSLSLLAAVVSQWSCEIFIAGCTGSCHFDNFQCS